MQDLKDLIVSLLRNDSVIKAITGSTASNPRVYHYYAPDAVIDSDKFKAYITFALTAFPEQTQAVGEPTMTLAIWGFNQTSVSTVRDRVVALLDDDARRRAGTLTPLTTIAGRDVRAERQTDRDSFQENTKFAGITMQFRFGFSKV